MNTIGGGDWIRVARHAACACGALRENRTGQRSRGTYEEILERVPRDQAAFLSLGSMLEKQPSGNAALKHYDANGGNASGALGGLCGVLRVSKKSGGS